MVRCCFLLLCAVNVAGYEQCHVSNLNNTRKAKKCCESRYAIHNKQKYTSLCVPVYFGVCVCVVSLRVKENILYVQLCSNVCTILFVFEDLLGPTS